MRYRGREIDPVAFWGRYVEFPSSLKSGRNDSFLPKVSCPNPDHDTTKHHFQINGREPKVHCFAHCGISGSWEHAVAVIEGLYEKYDVDLRACQIAWDKQPKDRSQPDREQMRRQNRAKSQAKKIILRAASGKLSKVSHSEHVQRAAERNSRATPAVSLDDLAYESYLPPVALTYLAERGITSESVATWNLGWLPDEKRIAIPAKDEQGRLKFLIKRGTTERQQPKYLYTEGFPRTSVLFGACLLDLGMIRSSGLILVEGSLGTILNHQDGLRNTTAILGTGISEMQRRIVARIKPPRIYFMFDKDSAGIRNIEIAAGMLRKYPCYVVKFPKGKDDWDKCSREEKLRQISRAVPALKFLRENNLNVRQPRKEIHVG